MSCLIHVPVLFLPFLPQLQVKTVIPINLMAFLGNTGGGKGFENGKNSLCDDCHPQFSVSCALPPKYFRVLPSYLHMKEKSAALKGLFRKSKCRYLFCFHWLYTNPYSHPRGESSVTSMMMTVYSTPGTGRKGSPWWHGGGRRVAWTRCACGHCLAPCPCSCTQRVSKDRQPLRGS